jgi:quercetin dioxygenase-like cupin family protein
MMRCCSHPRLMLVVVSAGLLVAVAAASPGQAPPSTAAEDAARFTGATSTLDASALRATRRRFEAGARSAWHSHERGQLLFVEEGRGRVQKRGQAIRDIGPGESDYTGPNVVHWHGGTPDRALVQAALAFGGETKWMEKVTDAEYMGKGR